MSVLQQTVAELTKHGSLVLFVWVSAEQFGLPVPAVPILIAAGVLSAMGQVSFVRAVALGVVGCLVGDLAWYALGRRRGSAVLRIVCRIALEPETCVRRSSNFISRYGARSLLVAKFIPGISAVAVPLAANSGLSVPSFLLHDLVGSALYVTTYVALGRFVGDRLDELSSALHSMTNGAFGVAMLAALVIVARRFRQRRAFREQVRMARIAPEELRDLIERGQNPFIVDVRHALDALTDPRVIPGAIRLTPDELTARHVDLPRDREIILYCT